MGYDPNTAKVYTPEEREALDELLKTKTGEELENLKKQIAAIEDITEEEYQEVEPQPEGDRRAWWAGRVQGKDRKKSRRPKMTKKEKHRRDRAMRKAARGE